MPSKLFLLAIFSLLFIEPVSAQKLAVWLTRNDQTALLEKQKANVIFADRTNEFPTIGINEAEKFQTIDGFGFTLTGGSAYVINRLSEAEKDGLLKELFGSGENSIGISYLRISIGASDLNFAPFSYDDLPTGATDANLDKFSLSNDSKDLIPLLQEIIRLNPRIKILGSPWSAPVWMKDNGSFKGGSLQPKYYGVYARYFVKYIGEMQRLGIKIDAITPQNEPLHPGNNPSMLMTAPQQADFIKNHLGPEFKRAKIKTKIIVYDHNCDKPEYPIEVLNDADAKKFVDGSAFHLYNGEISALTTVRDAHPDKNIYFTEQYTSSKSNFAGDFNWHIKNVVIGATRNWSKVVLEWNLANDAEFNPHTPGGCPICQGAITVDNDRVTRNVGYYIIAHAAKFVPPGSIRIKSNLTKNISNAAFKTPTGKTVLIAQNDGKETETFNIKFKNKTATASLPAGGAATFVWK